MIRGFLVSAALLLWSFNGWAQNDVQPGDEGRKIYFSHGCSECHGEAGRGGIGPALAGNPKILNTDYLIFQVLNGGGGMPGFERQLSAEQVAAVTTFIGSSWGNELEPVGRSDVEDRQQQDRQQQEDRQQAEPELTVDGSQIHAWNCMNCHGVVGRGGVGPAFVGNSNLADTTFVVAQIQLGGGGMPPFNGILSPPEIAAVASYIRESWGNDFGEVDAEQVRLQWEGDADSREGDAASREGDAGSVGEPAGDVEQPSDREQQEVGNQPAGEGLFVSIGCAGCHSSGGAGGIGPALNGNSSLGDAAYVVNTIRNGAERMPAFGDVLSEEQIALLATYVRTAWSNDFGPVHSEQETELPLELRRSQVDPVRSLDRGELGERLFSAVGCVGCHSANGAGGIGPPLNGNPSLRDADYVINTISTGAEQMPAFGGFLTDEQLAALANHVRTAWGNDFGPVSLDRVVRLQRHTQPNRVR